MATPTDPNAPSGAPLADVAPGPGPTVITQPLPAGANLLGAVEIGDGSGRIVDVKAGATAAGGGDRALVVAQSPNSPTPAGANHIGAVAVDTALPAGNNNIGDVDIATTPGLLTADVSIKAAATPAGAGDKALVVAQSPNTPTPAGANHIGGVTVDSVTPDPLTAAAPTQVAVGVADAVALAANAARRGLVLTNRSANNISLGLGAAAVLDSGITLLPNDSWQMDRDTFTRTAIHAIATAAGSVLGIQEFS